VTALEAAHFSMTIILSVVVPNSNSLTDSASPNLADVISWNLGMILPPVARAINSMSTPPTHQTGDSYAQATGLSIWAPDVNGWGGSTFSSNKDKYSKLKFNADTHQQWLKALTVLRPASGR
jgi:hypothetical protein